MSSPVQMHNMPTPPHHHRPNVLQQRSNASNIPIQNINPGSGSIDKANSLPIKNVVTHVKTNREVRTLIRGTTVFSTHRLNKQLNDEEKGGINSESVQIRSAIAEKTTDMALRFQGFEISLHAAGMLKTKVKAESYHKYAFDTVGLLKRTNYFNPESHYSDYLMTAYDGIDCAFIDENGKTHPHMENMRRPIFQLKRAIALDPVPASTTCMNALSGIMKDFKTILDNLNIEGKISDSVFQAALTQLDVIEGQEDPFKEEFEANTDLFRSIRNAPIDFKQKNIHLQNPQAFLKKYPEAATIGFPNEHYSLAALDEVLAKAVKSPLVNVIQCNSNAGSIIVHEAAVKIRNALLDKPTLRVWVGGDGDANAINDSFNDFYISRGQCGKDAVTNQKTGKPVGYEVYILPENPFTRRIDLSSNIKPMLMAEAMKYRDAILTNPKLELILSRTEDVTALTNAFKLNENLYSQGKLRVLHVENQGKKLLLFSIHPDYPFIRILKK